MKATTDIFIYRNDAIIQHIGIFTIIEASPLDALSQAHFADMNKLNGLVSS